MVHCGLCLLSTVLSSADALARQPVYFALYGGGTEFDVDFEFAGDLSFDQRVALCHEYFGGKAIFSANAPLYAIHFEDVVDAVIHALEKDLRGIYNVCDNDNLPGTNKEVFDAICRNNDMALLEFLDQIKAPLKKISAAKLYATGYRVQHADPNADIVARNQEAQQ